MKSRKYLPILWLLLIPILGLCWRALMVGWGLPTGDRFATLHPDEPVMLAAILKLNLAQGQFDTGFYNYGTLSLYIMNIAIMMGETYGRIHSAASHIDWAGLYLAGRWVSLLANVVCCGLVVSIAYRLRGMWTAVFAGLLSVGSLTMLVNSIYLTVDSTAAMFVTSALYLAVLYYRQPQQKYLLWAGVLCGMAAATRYNSGLTLLPIILSALCQPALSAKLKRNHIISAIIVTAVSFFICCPGPIINSAAFWRDLGYESQHVRTGHGLLFEGNGPGWYRHLVNLCWGVGALTLAAGAVGIWRVLRKMKTDKSDGLWLFAVWCLLLFVFQSLFAVRFSRYLLPMIPALCVITACAVWELRGWRKNAHHIMAAVILLSSWIPSVIYTRAVMLPDARIQAMRAIDFNVPNGSTIGFGTTPWFYSPPLLSEFGAIEPAQRRDACANASRWHIICPETEWQSVILDESQYIVVSDFEYADALRTKQPEAVDFFARLHSDFHCESVFDNRGLLLRDLPHDMLYPVPHLELWQRVGVAN